MTDVKQIADKADIIVNGYAFFYEKEIIKAVNLNNMERAVVIDRKGNVLETTMDDIEIDIVIDYMNRNQKYVG